MRGYIKCSIPYQTGAAATCRLVGTDLYCSGSPNCYSIRKESVNLTTERSKGLAVSVRILMIEISCHALPFMECP